jgi:membrane-associated HD superfamily phosphohydrolase
VIKVKEASKANGKVILDGWKRKFLFTLIFILTYFILITAVAPRRYKLIEGDIATVDIKANRNIIDEEATSLKEKEASEKVPKQYALKGEVKIQATENITTFFNKLINLKSNNISDTEKLAQIKKVTAFNLTDEEYRIMLGLSVEAATELQWVIQGIVDKIYENNIEENKEEDIIKAKQIVDRELLNTEIDSNIKEILRDMAYSQIKPNYVFDKEKTDELIREALKSVTKVMIKQNQIIVKEGEPITEKQIAILTDLGIVGEGVGREYFITYIILGVFLFFISFLQYWYLKREKTEIFKNIKLLILIALLNILSMLLARVISIISPFLIPLACAPILMTVLVDYRVSVIINVLNAALIMIIVGFDPQIALILIVNIIIGSISLKKLNQRNDILYSTLYIVIGVTISALTSGILSSNDFSKLMINIMLAALGALMSGVLAIGLLPFLESTFDIVTNLKLLELANPNNVLMKRLLMEAPGTYHHSIMVAI